MPVNETKAALAERKAALAARRANLTAQQRMFFFGQWWVSDYGKALMSALRAGVKPSAFFRKEIGWARGTCVLERHWDAFLWAIDACRERPYQLSGWVRRPFRGGEYGACRDAIMEIARMFAGQDIIDADLCDILSGRVPDERSEGYRIIAPGYPAELIAYELDNGNDRLKALLAACLNGDEGAPRVNRTIFIGIQLSGCREMHALLGKLLLAARLQEGLRQSICEAADEGTIPAFLTILGVIADNNLIRFSSVRRAVGAWTGLISEDPKDLERVSDKTLALLVEGLGDAARRAEMLESEDSMALYMALWTEAMTDVDRAAGLVRKLIGKGTRHQAAVSCYFASVTNNRAVYLSAAKAALTRFPDDREILALCLPAFMAAALDTVKPSYRTPAADAFKASDAQWYPRIKAVYERLPAGDSRVSPTVFPWLDLSVCKADLACVMCGLAAAGGDDVARDDAIRLLPKVDSGNRDLCMKALIGSAERPTQRAALMTALGDKSQYTRGAAFEIAEKLPVEALDIAAIEGHLRLKAPDARTNCLALLLRQDDEALAGSVRRLLGDPLLPRRAAGYDLVLQIAADADREGLKSACAGLLPAEPPEDTSERALWESARAAAGVTEASDTQADALFTDADRYEPDISFIWDDPKYTEAFLRLFLDSAVFGGAGDVPAAPEGGVCPSCAQARADIRSLCELIDAHREDSIGKDPVRGSDEARLLGYDRLSLPVVYANAGLPFPLAALWESWYEGMQSPERLVRMALLLGADMPPGLRPYARVNSLMDALFGSGFSRPEKAPYHRQAFTVCNYLLSRHGCAQDLYHAAIRAAGYLATDVAEDRLVWVEDELSDGPIYNGGVCIVTEQYQLQALLRLLETPPEGFDPNCYAVCEALTQRIYGAYALYARTNALCDALTYLSRIFHPRVYRARWMPTVADDLRAAHAGIITRRAFYLRLFERDDRKDGLETLTFVSLYVRTKAGGVTGTPGRGWLRHYVTSNCLRAVWSLTGKRGDFTEADLALLRDADAVYERLMPVILESELRRGDSPAEWSDAISGIQYIRGVQWLGRLLGALGKEPFDRSLYTPIFSEAPDRRQSLSHLLSVCVPDAGDTVDALAAVIREYRIDDRRLVETALYNTAWVPLIGAYLGWPGFGEPYTSSSPT